MQTSDSPIILYDREGALGNDLITKLPPEFSWVFISEQKKNKSNIYSPSRLHSLVAKHKDVGAIVIVHSDEKKFATIFRQLFYIAKLKQIPILYIGSADTLSNDAIARITISYEHVHILVTGEILTMSPTLHQMINDLKSKNVITLSDGGLEKVFITPSDVLNEAVRKILSKAISVKRIYYLFPEVRLTKFTVAQLVIAQFGGTLEFKKTSAKKKKRVLMKEGSYLLASKTVPTDSIKEYLQTLRYTSLSISPQKAITRREKQFIFLTIILLFLLLTAGLSGFYFSKQAEMYTIQKNNTLSSLALTLSKIGLFSINSITNILPNMIKTPLLQSSNRNSYTEAKLAIQTYSQSPYIYLSKLTTLVRTKQEYCLIDNDCSQKDTVEERAGSLPYSLFGYEHKRSYLVLLQNERNLQPGGGSIVAYALLSFIKSEGTITPFKSINTLDASLVQKLVPPLFQQLAYGTTSLYLRDSAYTEDIAKNAELATFLYNLESQNKIDGVFYVSSTGLLKLLHGNIDYLMSNKENTVAEFNKQIKLPEITLADMEPLLKSKHLQIGLANELEEEQLLLSLKQTSFIPFSAKQVIPDVFGMTEANIGQNDVNPYIERAVSQDITIQQGKINTVLKITLKNNSSEHTKNGGEYKAFFQVTLPQISEITKILIDEKDKVFSLVSDKSAFQRAIFPVVRENQNKISRYGFFIDVPTQKSQSIEISYSMPINSMTVPFYYDLQINKQAGVKMFPYQIHIHSAISGNDGIYSGKEGVDEDKRLQFLFDGKQIKPLQ